MPSWVKEEESKVMGEMRKGKLQHPDKEKSILKKTFIFSVFLFLSWCCQRLS